jgi:hypothetical protein
MLLILRSSALPSASTTASVSASLDVFGPVAAVPPAAPVEVEPVVTPAALFAAGLPEELAVPALLVPGAVGIFAGLPTPAGSLPELLRPPALAGPAGTPLTAALPAPAEPALGEPAALPLPADGPLAAPPALPPLAPPALCEKDAAGNATIAIATIAAVADVLVMENLLYRSTAAAAAGSAPERFASTALESASLGDAESGPPCAS